MRTEITISLLVVSDKPDNQSMIPDNVLPLAP